MKTLTHKLLVALLVAPMLVTSCSSDFLERESTTTITKDKVAEVGDVSSLVTGLYSWMIQYNSLNGSKAMHSDFGHLAIMLMTDLMNEDMIQNTANYGWFYNSYDFSLRPQYETVDVYMPWNYYYKLIKSSNDIIGLFDNSVTDETKLQYKGQALAMRAFAYLYLVQLYQHTYVGHQNAPAVPIVTETTTGAEGNNNPRATVQAVYDLIISDLTQADTLLATFKRPENVKTSVDRKVVKGLLARVYLNMENGVEAAKYARSAREGYKASTAQWSYDLATGGTGFTNIAEPDWMWGADVTSQTRIATTGIANPTSHLSSISYGYATAGNMQKMIDADLYAKIPMADIRRKAFADADVTVNGYKVPKFANLKFGYYSPGVSDNFGDYVFMRASEMYLIEAEGLALSGRYTEAQDVLCEFVKTRNPSYQKSIEVGDKLLEEIYLQRRIELWGEGFSYFDHKRLKLGVKRTYLGSNHKENAKVDYLPEADVFRFRIPRNEMISNKGITENNP